MKQQRSVVAEVINVAVGYCENINDNAISNINVIIIIIIEQTIIF